MRLRPDDFRFLLTLVGTLTAVGLALAFLAIKVPKDDARLPPPPFSIIAKKGEWITRPNGTRVCRLASDLWTGMTMVASYCEEWQGGRPRTAEIVPWLRYHPGGGAQILVEGRWRP